MSTKYMRVAAHRGFSEKYPENTMEAFRAALDAGADDVITDDDCFEIRTAPADFSAVRKYFEEKNLTLDEADVLMVPNDKIELNADQMVSFMKMLDAFDDNDDVQDVYHNVILPDDDEEE